MNWTEKLGIIFAVALMALFALDGAYHAATWIVAASAIIESMAMGIWIVRGSRWRQRSERAPR